ncbi:DinB family protein [Actinopolymorpha sp. B11F2]|uniref:DinB family protein n=1 Tax=Actinopolymorpha sp. B11F2 TaxID=3160862 RepID=UPI0032E3AA82
MSWIAPEVERVDEPFTGDERSTLEGFLEWGRYTLLHKCGGLTAEQLALQAVPPSTLSLLGLIRHVTEVERSWFRQRFAGQDVPGIYNRPGKPDADFEDVDPRQAEATYNLLVNEWHLSRDAMCGRSLDETFAHPRFGPMSLRWILCHMCSEYDRHNGHADMLRERIDGRTGT